MTDLRTRIANLHMNLPTLKRRSTSDGPKEEIILFEGSSKKSSIVEKLSKHRPNVLEESKKPEDDAFKWLRIKEKMVMDMENRRDEEWKKQTASDRLENEELEEEEAVEEDLFGTDDDAESEAGDAKDDGAAEDENDGEIEEDEDEAEDDIAEDEEEEDEEEEALDRRGNAFIDDQAVEDDEDSDEELFVRAKSKKSQTKPKMIIEDDSEEEESDHEVIDATGEIAKHQDDDLAEEENETNKNELDTCPFPFPALDTQESDVYLNSSSGQFCISQNLLLTPLDEVEEEELREIGSPSRAPADDCLSDTQALANLCSGQFGFDSAAEAANEDEVDVGIGFHSDDDNMIESEAEADGEMADDEEEDEVDPSEAATTTTIVRRKNRPRISDFIEDEAELSGSEEDVSSDENDDEDGDEELEEDAVQEDLPSDDEMREQANRKYLKDLEDEDKRRMMILMEQYFEDGDLHDENGDRKKKFKWNMNDEQLMEQFANVLSDSEDENDTQSNDDDSGDEASGKRMVVRLKKEVVATEASLTTTIEPTTGDEETSAPGISTKSTTQSIVRTTLKKKMTNTSIRSFFIKDERLKNILSNNKRSANGEGRGPQFNKKQKVVESRSIFDVLGC